MQSVLVAVGKIAVENDDIWLERYLMVDCGHRVDSPAYVTDDADPANARSLFTWTVISVLISQSASRQAVRQGTPPSSYLLRTARHASKVLDSQGHL